MIHPVRDIRQGRRSKRYRVKMREEAINERAARVEAGLCAKTPAGLIAPSCASEKGHEGRCSWGAFFEPSGEFHAVDPDGSYPMPRLRPHGYYCGWCKEIGYWGMFGPGPDAVCSNCGKNLNEKCPKCNAYGHAGYPWLRSHRDHCPKRPIWRTVKNLLRMYYKHACGIGCADYIREQEWDFLRRQLRRPSRRLR